MHGKSMLAVSFVILLLVVVLSANAVTLKAKDRTYQAQEQELKRQIEEEKERSQEIDKLEQYVGKSFGQYARSFFGDGVKLKILRPQLKKGQGFFNLGRSIFNFTPSPKKGVFICRI